MTLNLVSDYVYPILLLTISRTVEWWKDFYRHMAACHEFAVHKTLLSDRYAHGVSCIDMHWVWLVVPEF